MTRGLTWQRIAAALALGVPVNANAQVPVYPNQPEAPVNLDPGRTGNQIPEKPAPAAQPARPNVVIVGPDGKVIGGDSQPGTPSDRYYVPGGNGGGQTYDAPDVIHTGPVPELHVVRRGDTLWDIGWYYFNDPWQWPKIWSYNAQITNPHWIYPGDLVRLLPRGVFVSQGNGGTQLDPEPGPAKPNDPVPSPQRRTDVSVKQTAFVEKSDLQKSITIEGAVDEKVLLGVGDQVYLSYPAGKPPEVGKRYSVYVPGKPVKSGKNEYGSYVRLLGTVEVKSVKQDKRARGVIVDANQEIERGAKVGPLLKTFQNVPTVAPTVDAQAPIVAMLTKDQLIGQGEVVFVSLGKSSGVKVGNRMFVIRRGDGKPDNMSNEIGSDDRRFPARALGEIVIVEVGEKVSIGLVTLSVQEMSVGDLVMMQKSK